MTSADALPDRNASDEDRYEPADALCDVCGRRPGEIAQDGEWICTRCVVLLELADPASPGGVRG